MKKVISGIQQLGVGVTNVDESFTWYRRNFGSDIKVFEDDGEAALMLPYTGGQPHKRKAILALNLNGGGGFEIWQYKSRKPVGSDFEIQVGDLGIFAGKIKTKDIHSCFEFFKAKNLTILSAIEKDPESKDHFFIKDLNGNIYQVVSSDNWFSSTHILTGGTFGAIIGVENIEKSIEFYSEVLGYDQILYDKEGLFDDFKILPGGSKKFRRVLLTHSQARKGAFSRILGPSQIELVKVIDREPKKIFQNRLWGDLGFIHLCFDVKGLDLIKKDCESLGFKFTVDTGSSFDMGETAGRFAYVEDPNGTLIEFVETYKVPILKKFGIYLNLKKRDPEKPFPDWIIKMFRFSRVKD